MSDRAGNMTRGRGGGSNNTMGGGDGNNAKDDGGRGGGGRRIALAGAFVLLCGALVVSSVATLTPVGAQTADGENANNGDASEEGGRSFSFSGSRTVVVFSEGREKTTLSGNATVISNSTEVRANYIEVYGEDFRFVECVGDVEVKDDERGYRLTTDSLFFDREVEIIRGRGNNVMEDFNNEIVIKGEFLEHRNIENRSEIQVSTRILGEDITATAEFVRYQRDTEILEFSGLPLVRWKGDQYQAARIIVDMKNDTVDLQGEVYGEIKIENAEEEEGEAENTTIIDQLFDIGRAEQETPDATAPDDALEAIDAAAPDTIAPDAIFDGEATPDTIPDGEATPDTTPDAETTTDGETTPDAIAPDAILDGEATSDSKPPLPAIFR